VGALALAAAAAAAWHGGVRAAQALGAASAPIAAPIAEDAASVLAARTGAAAPWARGASGTGQAVGLLDTGVRATHVEFGARVRTGLDAVTGGIDTGDSIGHGTHVAGLLAAARNGTGIAGVAPAVQVLPVRVFAQGGASDAALSAGVRWAAARTTLLNLSLTSTGPIAAAALRDAIAGGALAVAAAGNRGAAHPDWPARFARESWANGQGVAGALIAVGAVDAHDRIADFSNRAGDTARFFLVAPGTGLLSAWASGDGAYERLSGTSMAAPAVSGAAALLKQLWPHLGAREVAEILLATARDLGAPGTDPVYGRGLLDLAAALQPVGGLATATAGGPAPLAATGLRLSPATAGVAQAASAGLPVVARDAYRRDFATDLAPRIVLPLPVRVDAALARLDARFAPPAQGLPGGARLRLGAEGFALAGRDAAGDFTIAGGARAHEAFGVAAGVDVPALANPYAALGPQGAMLARGLTFGATALRAGLLAGEATQHSGGGWQPVQARTMLLEAAHRAGDALRLSATFSRTLEQGAWLGAVGSGALALDVPARTDALQFGAVWTVSRRATLAAAWALGRTPGAAGTGLVARIDPATSDAVTFALVLANVVASDDGLSFAVSQPLRARSGAAHLWLQQGTADDGTPMMGARTLSLVPGGRERVFELGWRVPVARDQAVSTLLQLRHEPNHDASAPADAVVAVRYRRVF
jgi:hypothetical protein